jgi:hypothetical protein
VFDLYPVLVYQLDLVGIETTSQFFHPGMIYPGLAKLIVQGMRSLVELRGA